MATRLVRTLRVFTLRKVVISIHHAELIEKVVVLRE